MYDTDKWRWVVEHAIVDVPRWNAVPTEVGYELYHVHSNGKCIKNRLGPLCGVDNDY